MKNLFGVIGIVILMSFSNEQLFAQSNVVPDAVELQALKNIYDSLGGASWTNKSGWPTAGNWPATATATQMDAWYGVVVTNGDISGLNLNTNALTGQIPKTISQLSRLTTLLLNNNQIEGTIPASLGTLTGLITFYANNNKITGAIPGSLNNLTSLTHLYLNNNLFTGDIPNLGSLINLRELYLGINNFNPGPIPAWISNLNALRILVLSSCNRNGSIPTTIGNLSNLTHLHLQSNQLTGSIPSSIGNITTLQHLFLFTNQLSGSIPSTIGNLNSLISLQAYANQLTGPIPATIGNLSNLVSLQLSSNQLSGIIPSEIGSLTKLTDLFLHVNKLEGSLPASIGNLSNLVQLYLYGNKLTGSLPPSIGNLSKLVVFYAYGNLFTGQIPSTLGNLTNLTGLQLNSNQLTGTIPAELGNLTKLTQLYLNNNKLTGTIPSSFGNLINLNRLYLSVNQLTGELPSNLGNLTKMAYFYGGGNQLVGTIPASFANWSQIYLFDISAGKFSGALPDNLFSTWTKLVTFNISNNNFTGSFPSSISSCTLLTSLSANINKFSSVPASILTLPVTTAIIFDNNELTSIPNFANHVNKTNLNLTVSYNRLDFTHLEPLVGAGIKILSPLIQKSINDVTTLSMNVGSDLTLTARPKGGFTNNIKWEKLQPNGVTWADVSTSNTDALTGNTYRIANATATAEGTYRWSATSTKATGVTITSDPLVVKTPQRLVLDNLGFQYKYDGRRRMVQKKVPGADWVYMVYDNRDRLVLTQDGEQRKFNRWTFTKYDELNRPIMTGIRDTSLYLSQEAMQAVVNAHFAKPSAKWGETYVGNVAGNVHGYTNKSYPVRTGTTALEVDPNKYLTVTYYDNYSFRQTWLGDYSYKNESLSAVSIDVTYNQPAIESMRVIGQVTGTKVKILESGSISGFTWLKAINYYDDKYRIIQNITDNFKGGFDIKTNVWDFSGKLLKNKNTHTEGAVTWRDMNNMVVDGNKLVCILNASSGAASVQELPAGQDGWLEAIVTDVGGSNARWIGLSDANIDNTPASIDYAFYLAGNNLNVAAGGVHIGTVGTLRSGDIIRLERAGSAILYKHNGNLVYTYSTIPSTTSLLVDVSFNNSSVAGVRTSFSQTSSSVTRDFTYDHAGRLLKTFHSVNEASPVLLAQNEYNELGQLVDKNLHNTDPENTPDANRQYKQSVDYRYNIRGWLTHINNAELASNTTNDDTNDLFGMNLSYNELVTGLSTIGDEQYNGNISAISYSANQGLGAIKERGYKFGYDPMNRLLSATHKEKSGGWANSLAYHEDNLQYDLNGNILKLNRKGENGSNMDELTYAYGTGSAFSNQLQTVSDAGALQAGFIDGNIGSTDYLYDLNGNMVVDRNKGITAITYNHLNLPDRVTKSTGDYVKYNYDASGRKLNQGIFNTTNAIVKKTDYLGEYVYENDELAFINHEEGRITKEATGKQLIASPQLVPNNDAASTSGFLPVHSVVLTSETLGSESYLKVVSNQASSTPGFTTNFIAVKSGKTYRYKFKGYRTTSAAFLYVIGDVGSSIVWATKALPAGAINESWVEVDFMVPSNVSRIKVGVLWSPVTVGDVMYVNKIELYELDPVNGMNIEVDVAGAFPSEYQYHLKDHLGNVRLTFTSKVEEEEVVATLETTNENEERGNFLKYDDIRKVNSRLFDHTHAPGVGTTHYAMRLSGTPQETYGLARSIAVMPGDVISAEVFAKYVDLSDPNIETFLEDLIANILAGTTSPGVVIDGGNFGSPSALNMPYGTILNKTAEVPGVPKAYLNWIVFDKNFVPLTGANKSGFRRISSAAMENGALAPEGVLHEKLESPLIEIDEPGYVYIYLSNEEAGTEVYFDDFKVTHTKSPVIQSDDYYPFGMTFNSYSRENSTSNQFLYNGKELQDELNLGWYDYQARYYDPTLSRWSVMDRRSELIYEYSPFAYSLNNPVNVVDHDGEIPIPLITGAIGAIGGVLYGVIMRKSGKEIFALGAAGFIGGATLGLGPAAIGALGGATAVGITNAAYLTGGSMILSSITGELTKQGVNNLTGAQKGFSEKDFVVTLSLALPEALLGGIGNAGTSGIKKSIATELSKETTTREANAMVKQLMRELQLISDGRLTRQEARKAAERIINAAMEEGKSVSRFTIYVSEQAVDVTQITVENLIKGEINDLLNEQDKESQQKAEKTKNLLGDAMSGNLESGTYTWNGSNWIRKN